MSDDRSRGRFDRDSNERWAGKVVDIDPIDAGRVIEQRSRRGMVASAAPEFSARVADSDEQQIHHIGGRRKLLRPEVVLIVVGAVFLVGALLKPWSTLVPASSQVAAASAAASPSTAPSASAAVEPSGAIAAAPTATVFPDIPPSDYRFPFFGSAPAAETPGSSALPSVGPTPTWSAVDWSVLTGLDTHSGWGFTAALMPGGGPGGAVPNMSWVDAGSPPVYASVPLVQGLNVYAVAVTWPSSVRVTAIKFVYLGPPQSPPYLPPAGFLPNVQVTPMPALRVASPPAGAAASPTIPAWVDPASGTLRSGEFLIPPSDQWHNAIATVLSNAWQTSPWPWPYGSYEVTVTTDTGSKNIILDLLLNLQADGRPRRRPIGPTRAGGTILRREAAKIASTPAY
jgi:hypothetical protein